MKPKVIVVDAYGTVLDITSYNGQECEDRFFQRGWFGKFLEELRDSDDVIMVCVSSRSRKEVTEDMEEAGVDISMFDRIYRFNQKPDFKRIARDYRIKPSGIEFIMHLWYGWRESLLAALQYRICIAIPSYIQISPESFI